MGYNPRQPRADKGSDIGGQWIKAARAARRGAGLDKPKVRRYENSRVRTLKDLLHKLKDEGGFSQQVITGKQPTKGYMTAEALDTEYSEPVSHIDVFDLAKYINRHAKELQDPNVFFGGWVSTDDMGVTRGYLDLSRNIVGLDEALRVARKGQQLAIWDVEKGQEVRVK